MDTYGIEFLWIWMTGVSELPDVGAGNRTQLIWKNRKDH